MKTIPVPTSFRGGIALAAAISLGLAGCASTPRDSAQLESARAAVHRAEAQGDVAGPAKSDLDAARSNLALAESAQDKGKPASQVDNYAYIAEQSALAAIARHESVMLQKRVEAAEGERSRVLLEAREREAKMAQHKAETAEMEAARVQHLAVQQAAALDRTQQQLNATTSQLNAANVALIDKSLQLDAKASELQAKASELDASNAALKELEGMNARRTDRGMVLVLDDVLFDTGSATMNTGADRSLQLIAEFLRRNENARLLVEGHTDSVGDEGYNQQLSERRAASVASRLAQYGIASSRISAVGLGEAFPVTGNATAAGRQQNRRVEIVFSDNRGDFPAAAQRTAGVRY